MFGWFKSKAMAEPVPAQRNNMFSTHGESVRRSVSDLNLPDLKLARATINRGETIGLDDEDNAYDSVKPIYNNGFYGVPETTAFWYTAQSFIGYQMCSLLAQHWLIDKACSMPGKDAVRKGWELTVNDGQEMTPEMLAFVSRLDKRMRIKWHLQEYFRKGRIFGIRVLMFKVDSADPLYYEKPFNIDGVAPGAYKGMVQIDPYWCAPELEGDNVTDPTNMHFYEPEYWRIAGVGLVHRTHVCLFTTGQVSDVLKPTYLYGGVPVPQKIYERVYAAERVANEAPMLAMTKRLNVLKTDILAAIANESQFSQRMEWATAQRDNYGQRIIGMDDTIEQYDITLTDMDNLIMTQYQIVAMQADVPGTKLLGTQPKGFNSTGDYEEASYHEFLETLQANDGQPVLDRHYELISKSYIQPKFGVNPLIEANWNELDAMTALELAQLNAEKAGVGAALVASGAIDGEVERDRIIADPDSGYSGIGPMPPMPTQPALPAAPGGPPKGGTPAAAAAAAIKPPLPRAKPPPGA